MDSPNELAAAFSEEMMAERTHKLIAIMMMAL